MQEAEEAEIDLSNPTSDEVGKEEPIKSGLIKPIKRWDWKENIEYVLAAKKGHSPNYINCYLDREKNISKSACYSVYHSY